jgi:hypothetical protein
VNKTILIFVILAFLGFGTNSHAGKIEKAFQALKEYNYFKAKTLFTKTIKKDISPSSYGLALIHFRTDNPFHSLDSSFTYILQSEKTYGEISEKKKIRFKKFGFDYLNIIELRAKISTKFFQIAENSNTIEAYTKFINTHTWANELFLATHRRDSLAYDVAKQINTSEAYKKFLDNYPLSSLYSTVQSDFYRAQYREITKANTLAAYLEFIAKFPDNPYVIEAEDRIYEIVTESKTIGSYSSFIKSYPKNRNVGEAWKNIYQLYMVDFSDDRIEQFKAEFPTYPYWDQLEEDIKFLKLQLLPFKNDLYYGYMDYSGKIIIPAEYEQLGFFKEGLAFAVKNGLYGYIDKGNRIVIEFEYDLGSDFENGRAIVEKSGKIGMIDRSGNVIFPIEFMDLGQLSEGLVYGAKDSLYAYYDNNYNLRIPERFIEAYEFSNGIAKVQVGENQAFIDRFGSYAVAPGYPIISFHNDSLLVFSDGELEGIMRKNFHIIVPAQFEVIGQLSLDRALVMSNNLIGYIDGKGTVVIQPQFEEYPNYLKRAQFHSNLAVIRLKGKFGIIDKSGKVIIPTTYNEIGDISSLVAYSKGKGWGFIDLNNKVIIQPEFDYAESFKDGMAIVEKMTLQGLINAKKEIIIPIEFTSVSKLSKDLFIVSNGSKFGVYSSTGEVLVPIGYQQIMLIDSDFLLLTNTNELHYLYLPEKRIIKPLIEDE